jgi:hypothetical protein
VRCALDCRSINTCVTQCSGMLHRSLVATGGHGHGHGHHVPKKIIERSAQYTHSTTLGWYHFHPEANFRKRHLGFKAYSKENMDIFGQNIPFPVRHFDTKAPGMWMGAGHHNPKQWGPCKWLGLRKWWMVSMGGTFMPMCTYYKRMSDNGFEHKNKGAVFGMD